MRLFFPGRSINTKKGDGSQIKESTDSSTTIEDDDVKGRAILFSPKFLAYTRKMAPVKNGVAQ